jgi:hypothetical protein
MIYRNKMVTESKTIFNIFEVHPKYLFINKHKNHLILRQVGAKVGETQCIYTNSRQNLVWFLRNGKRGENFFNLTL